MTKKKKAGSGEETEASTADAPVVPPKAPGTAPATSEPKAKAKAPAVKAAAVEPKAEAAPKPKAKAKGDAKAKAEVKAEAKPKAKAEAKVKAEAKPKAEAKSKAEAKPKGEAKPKADAKPKAEAKAKADPKAKAKADAKATPKAKGKVEAKAPAPLPVIEPASITMPTAGDQQEGDLQVVARKKRRNRKKAEEVSAEAMEAEEPNHELQEEILADKVRIKSMHDAQNSKLSEKMRQDLEQIKDLSTMQGGDVQKAVVDQRKALDLVLQEIDDTLKTVKVTRPKSTNTGKIMEQMREIKMCSNDGVLSETTKEQMLNDVREALQKALAFEAFRDFQTEMTELKALCERKIKENEEVAKTVRSGNLQRRILGRVAVAKGVKAEELNEKDVVSMTVSLPLEVTALNWLYQRRYEKQYGVVIDRPDGAKGGGKGASGSPPRSLIVRGVDADATACVAALKALDLSAKQIISVSNKQASSIMGAQQSNARKLEEEFKGVFITSEKDQVTLYGPNNQVNACYKHILTLKKEEPEKPAPTPAMTIDKDRARALIGAGGKNVQRIETETSTSIKVSIPSDRNDESNATVKIGGEKADQDKARAKIEAFLNGLEVYLAEAESEVVSRLYDSAVVRKGGKAKGRSKAPSEAEKTGNSKFAELRDHSGLTVLMKAKGVVLLGPKEEVNKWKNTLDECIKEASSVPASVKLTFEQGRLWTQTDTNLEKVRTASGAKVHVSRRQREAVLEIIGTDAEKEKAKEAIQEVHDSNSCVETIENISASSLKSLTGKGNGRTRDVEYKHEVAITVDNKAQAVKIMGAKASVEKARKAIEGIINTASTTKMTKEIEIEWDMGRVVIGKKGSTVRHIKQTSGVDDLQVEDGEEKKKVIFRGTEEAVEQAVQMVQEVLVSAKKKGQSTDGKPAGDGDAGDAKAGDGSAAPGGTSTTVAEDKSANVPAATPVAETEKRPAKGKGRGGAKANVNLESKELFPNLGGPSDDTVAKKKGKRPAGKSAWKTVEDDEELDDDVEDEDGAAEEAAEETQDAAAEQGAEESQEEASKQEEENGKEEEASKQEEEEGDNGKEEDDAKNGES